MTPAFLHNAPYACAFAVVCDTAGIGIALRHASPSAQQEGGEARPGDEKNHNHFGSDK